MVEKEKKNWLKYTAGAFLADKYIDSKIEREGSKVKEEVKRELKRQEFHKEDEEKREKYFRKHPKENLEVEKIVHKKLHEIEQKLQKDKKEEEKRILMNLPSKRWKKSGGRSKIVAGWLAIFLGNFGVHKFYLGKIGMGILYLVFFWTYIPSIIGLIEGIIYLRKTDEEWVKYYKKILIQSPNLKKTKKKKKKKG